MPKKILIINGHPNMESLNHAVSGFYAKAAAENNASVEIINIGELKFDPNLAYGYKKEIKLEKCLQDAVKKIKDAEHIVFVFPLWWGSYPALMKGFIDRVFLPKIAFDYDDKDKRIELFKGKSARIIITMEQPAWYYRLISRSCTTVQLKHITLNFCGIKNVKTTYFGNIGNMDGKRYKKTLETVKSAAQKDACRLIY
ncbi:MAG: NAD(P)H-dependent oxidoreductase [Campylobacteraceae bacterium]|jgi:putative NADPH-quinone reductase|nr:NAD(P)H-dependent oxidoreductase [Campylobacteraceae bacterium]